MPSYYTVLEYCGSGYRGFQRLGHSETPTVQGQVDRALALVEERRFEEVTTQWASRTDAGVHATGQVGKVNTLRDFSALDLTRKLNGKLPGDIRVVAMHQVDPSFNPIFHAQKKEYLYYFGVGPYRKNVFFEHPPYVQYTYPLNWPLIQQAISLLPGERDFFHFHNFGTPTSTTIRHLISLELIEVREGLSVFPRDNFFCFRFVGKSFLKQMVRLLVGALWAVGNQKLSLDQLQQLLINPRPPKVNLWKSAPAQGLFLGGIEIPRKFSGDQFRSLSN